MDWALNQIKKHDLSNEAHSSAVAGPVRKTEISQAEHSPTFNEMLHNMSCESYCLENNHSKKVLLEMYIALKIGNEHLDYENVEVHANCKERNIFFLKELISLQRHLDVTAALQESSNTVKPGNYKG